MSKNLTPLSLGYTVGTSSNLTPQLTSITFTAPTTPDYALQPLVQNTGFGFATANEGHTLLSVVANLQTRLAELEAALSPSNFT